MGQRIVIVGGVAGGANVAAQLRRDDSESDIFLFDKGEHVAFSTCGMPYYIGDVVEKRDHLLVNPDKLAQKYDIKISTNTEVISVDRANSQLTYQDASGKQQMHYDKLVLTPGASAAKPEFAGMNEERTFTLHTIPDMDRIKSFVETNKPRSCAIIGAGFVGMEMIENIQMLGLDCTLINHSSQVMKLVESDMASEIEKHIQEKGVQLLLNESLTSFSEDGTTLNLESGKHIQADMTILAVGIKPNTELAAEAGLTIGETGGIEVNRYMQTNDPDIYALGDAVQTPDLVTDKARNVALAGPAHRQAAIAANHINSKPEPYTGIQGTAIFKVFDLSVGATGLNKTELDELSINYLETTQTARAHAAYYPGADKVHLKLLFDAENGQLYGAQAVGKEGVDKRLAVLATAMKAGLPVYELPDLELGYAPPYSSPKDPVNIIGYKAASQLPDSRQT